MPHHLEPVGPFPQEFADDDALVEPAGDLDELGPLVRPAWWRWVAIAVVVAMVVTGPVAYVLFKLLD
jgi:hypothetical protein